MTDLITQLKWVTQLVLTGNTIHMNFNCEFGDIIDMVGTEIYLHLRNQNREVIYFYQSADGQMIEEVHGKQYQSFTDGFQSIVSSLISQTPYIGDTIKTAIDLFSPEIISAGNLGAIEDCLKDDVVVIIDSRIIKLANKYIYLINNQLKKNNIHIVYLNTSGDNPNELDVDDWSNDTIDILTIKESHNRGAIDINVYLISEFTLEMSLDERNKNKFILQFNPEMYTKVFSHIQRKENTSKFNYPISLGGELDLQVIEQLFASIDKLDPMNYKLYELLLEHSSGVHKELKERLDRIRFIHSLKHSNYEECKDLIESFPYNHPLIKIYNMKNSVKTRKMIKGLYVDFKIAYENKDFLLAMFLGTFIFSELGNYGLLEEQLETKVKTKVLFQRVYGKTTNVFVQSCIQSFEMKDTLSYEIDSYQNTLHRIYKMIEPLNGLKKYVDVNMLFNYISNYVGMGKNDLDYDLTEELQKFEDFNFFDDVKSYQFYYKYINNISIHFIKSKKKKEALLYFKKYDIVSSRNHPIIYNNYIGILLAQDKINKVQLEKLFKKYRDSILKVGEINFYGFFFNINLEIFKSKSLGKRTLEIPRFKNIDVPTIYDDAPIRTYFKYCLDYYQVCLNNEDTPFDINTVNKDVFDLMNYEYPYHYLFIDYQEWSSF